MKPVILFDKELSDYSADRWKHVQSALKKVSKDPNEEAIHKARVAIKKVVSLFHFLEFCHDHLDSKQELKILRKLFKELGEIRDHNNHLKLCTKFGIDPALFADRESGNTKAYKRLSSKCKESKKDVSHIKKVGEKHLRHARLDKWKTYIQTHRQSILSHLATNSDKDALHPMRKDIKDILYNTDIHNIRGLISRLSLNNMDALQDAIGTWHDVVDFRMQPEVVKYNLTHRKEATAAKKEEQKLYKEIAALSKKVRLPKS